MNGYDPTFGAGYIGGAVFNWSAKAPTLVALLSAPWLTPESAYKVYISFSVVSGPLFLAGAMRLLGGTAPQTFAAGVIGILLWWASYLSWYVTAGMVSYVWSAYFATYVGALFYRLCAESLEIRRLVLLATAISAGWWVHPHFPLLALLFTVPLLASMPQMRIGRVFSLGALFAGVALITSFPWLQAMLEGGAHGEGTLGLYGYQRDVAPLRLLREALGQFEEGAAGAKLNPVLLLGTTIAIVWCTGLQRRRAVALGSGWLVSQVFAYFGGAIELIANTQPNRIAPAGYLLLVLPAVWGYAWLYELGRRHWVMPFRANLVAVAGVLCLYGYSSLEAIREAFPGEHGRYGLPPPHFRIQTPLFDWLTAVVSEHRISGGRVLLEQSAARVFDGAHIAGLLALRTDAEFIGGPYASDNHVNFKDGRVLGRDILDLKESELREILDRYAVELMIVHSEAAKQALGRIPDLHFVGSKGPAAAYRRTLPVSVFLSGDGNVDLRVPGRLRLSGLGGTEVVLRYHYFQAVHSVPPAAIDGVPVDGEMPFIRITNPPKAVEISTSPVVNR